MNIAAVTKFSLIDYPGKISAVIFTQGCPLKCIYCHNKQMQSCTNKNNVMWGDVIAWLKTRVGLLDAVVFSGGEPLMQFDLYNKILEVQQLGFLVGIHTSGPVLENLKKIVLLADWVGLDIKTSFSEYQNVTQIIGSGEIAKQAFDIVINNAKDYEIRTTVDSRVIKVSNLIEIAKFLNQKKVKTWVLQQCILREEDIYLPLPTDQEIQTLNKYVTIQIRK